MSPDEHARMHSRAAQILHRENAPAETLARHLIAAGTAAGPWAAAVMEEAADQAAARGDIEHALRCLHFAQQLCGSEKERAAVTSKIAEVKWLADPALAIWTLPYLVRAVHQGILPGRNAAKVIHYQLWSGRPDEAVSTLGRATGGKPDADAEADLLAMRLWTSALYPGLPGPMAPPAVKAPPLLTSPQLQLALVLPELTAGKAPDAAVTLGHALQTSALDDTTLALVLTAMSLSAYSGQAELTALWSETFETDARLKKSVACPSQTWRALLAAIRADLNIRLGNLPAAEEQASTALTHISPTSWGVAIGAPLAVLVLAATAMGKLDEAADYLRVPVPDAMFLTIFGPLYINARGRYHLAAGKARFAIRDFETCGELVKHWNMDHPEFVPWRLGAAEAYLRLGAPQLAGRMLDEQPARAGLRRTRAYGMSLRLRAAASPVHDRAPLIKEAAELLYEECQDRLEAARAFADLGSTHDALGEHDQARLMRRRAEQLAVQCGAATLHPLQANAGIRQAGPRRAGVTAHLSGAERRVAALAASGYTNREIASKLFVTTSTVEQHLTRVYRKLKVNRRSDLPPLLRYEAAGLA
jgi:DNA-binding CsgD family transcriptional regulator